MLQNYAFIHKNNVFSENFVLNFLKSNNLKVLIAFFSYLCTINQNIEIMKIKIPFIGRSQMTMKEKIANPLSVEEVLELGKESIIPITDYWENDISHSNFNKLPFAVRMPKGLVTQAEEERIRARHGYFSDFYSPYHGFDISYLANKIAEYNTLP